MFTIVIAAKNEYQNLKILLPILKERYSSAEILVIDGSSKDGTSELCDSLGVRFVGQKSKGKGGALREASELTAYPTLIFFDGDCSHDPADIQRLVDPILNGDYKHVSGSRMLGGSSELFNEPGHSLRLIGTLITNYLLTIKFKYLITDAQNGLRAFDVNFLKSLDLKSGFFSIELEMVANTLSKGEPILEIPTHEHKRLHGSSKIHLIKHGSLYFMKLLNILGMKKTKIREVDLKTQDRYSANWLV
jgi:dolichol-phosphate mannosyltransferase